MSAPKAEAAGLTVERRAELRRVAEAVGEGPWESYPLPDAGPNHWTMTGVGIAGDDEMGHRIEAMFPQDAAHIAAFDPPTVLALLDALVAAEAERDGLLEAAQSLHDEAARLAAERDEARAAVERVRALADSVRGVFEADLNNPQTDYARGIRDGATATADDFHVALDTASSEAS